MNRMKDLLRWLLTLLACILTYPRTAGAEPSPNSSVFLQRVYTNRAGTTLPYRLALPDAYDTNRSYPLVVFLHGAIARGDDNEAPLNWGPLLIRQTTRQTQQPCFLLVPQCPKGQGWSSGSTRTPDALSQTVELIRDPFSREFRIDARRRYLTGVSMGGIGLWTFLCQHPGFFAAGVPVCAAGSPGAATAAAARFPIWAFHSDDDHLIPVQSAREMVQAWRKLGGTARYTEYTGLKHSSWKRAYLEPELFRWLFAQKTP